MIIQRVIITVGGRRHGGWIGAGGSGSSGITVVDEEMAVWWERLQKSGICEV
jgi:hypothetical protein